MSAYPIDPVLPQVLNALRTHPAVVLHAPPGAGKTTRVPLALLDIVPQGRIVMLEPRRIAAVSAARWMAKSLGEDAGGTVGYTIRFDSRTSARTRIDVVTEGILTRRIQADPGLEGTAIVIFDEFHERSIHADLALALCLDVRAGLRPDLKLLVMSATLDCAPVAALLGGAPVVSSTGRSFPVEERYLDPREPFLPHRIAGAVRTALRETNGDILAFLPGAGEIRGTVAVLRDQSGFDEQRISLNPLYGDLPFDEQERAILPSRDRRKVVLATNIAETSLTIEGVSVVVDSGLTRVLRHDPSTGMNRLITVPVSRASAEQRKGRAGRLRPGVCYRLYSEQDLRGLTPFTAPEITAADLAELALELAAWGVRSPASLAWLDAPPAAAWDAAQRLLRDLGAIDAAGSATAIGREMVRLPLHPRLSRMMLRARELGCTRLGADLAALLSERDILRSGGSGRASLDPDIDARLDALTAWRAKSDGPAITDPGALRAVERTAGHLMRLQRAPDADNAGCRRALPRILLAGFPDRVCKRRGATGQDFVHSQGRGLKVPAASHLQNSRYLVALSADAGEQTEGFIHLAAPVDEQDLRESLGSSIVSRRLVEWDRRERRIVGTQEERIGAVVLSSRAFAPSDDEAVPIVCAAIQAEPGLLSFTPAARQFRARTALMRRAFPEEPWPDLSDASLLSAPERWLAGWFEGVRTAAQIGKLDLLPPLKALLSWEQQRLLDERAPAALTVPSGSRITVDYTASEQPVLAVKLQELFGLADTPVLANGRVKVLLHLLSPARRPVQVTQDLRNFWDTVYPEVKKDLKGRYPKHPWPDDPWNAVPTRKAKPRRQ